MTNSHLPLQEQLTALAKDLAARGTPEDTYDNHSFLHPVELNNASSGYTELLEEHFSQFVGGRNASAWNNWSANLAAGTETADARAIDGGLSFGSC